MIMRKASDFFTEQEVSSVESAVAEAEAITSAEIVPVVASVSGRYDRAEDLVGFLLALIALSCCWWSLQAFTLSSETWSDSIHGGGLLSAVLVLLVLSFLGGVAIASRVPVLRLPFISKQEMQDEVELKARDSFQKLKVRNTQDSSGMLIYVSLYERLVHVIGDDAVSAHISRQDLREVCDTVIAGLKNEQPAEGMRKAVLRCGELLTPHFPVQENDENELANTFHLID